MDRRAALATAHLYLVTGAVDAGRLRAALAGGVDIVQLRMKDTDDDTLLEQAAIVRECCTEAGALFVLNDRPDLVEAAGADGVHVGQEDMSAQRARELAGEERLVGVSTHSPAQVDAAQTARVDYIGVGPVHATPTKPGRPAVGLSLIAYAAEHSALPWFAIGGIDSDNVADVTGAGAQRVAVVRAIADASDPRAAARALSAVLADREARLGIA